MYGIVETVDTALDSMFDDEAWQGVRIVCRKSTIQIAISAFKSCCEDFGINYYIDKVKVDMAELSESMVEKVVVSVEWDNTFPKSSDALERERYCYAYTNTAPVRIKLDNGRCVHIVPWNEHNGYYPHNVRVAWHNYSDTQSI
jgi:hypothetical protein